MVSAGKSIKQRGKSIVKRKGKPLRKYKSKFVGDERIRALWNHKLTTKQNYERIGLNADPNSLVEIRKSIAGAEHALDDDEEGKLFAVPDSDILSERNPRRPENYLSEEEIKYLRKQIAKHGQDYKAMERDVKTNNMQWSAHKLEKRCARLALFDAHVIKNRPEAATATTAAEE